MQNNKKLLSAYWFVQIKVSPILAPLTINH